MLYAVKDDGFKTYKEQLLSFIHTYEDMGEDYKGKPIKIKKSTDYFIENNTWTIEELCDIEHIKTENMKYKIKNRKVQFRKCSDILTLELKVIFHHKLFSDKWTLKTFFKEKNYHLDKLTLYLHEEFPKLNSLKDLDVNEADLKWLNWLEKQNINTMRQYKKKSNGDVYYNRSALANFLKSMIEEVLKISDVRDEWEKDRWDIRNLSQYGLYFNESRSHFTMSFENIVRDNHKNLVKKYCKERLIKNNNFTWETARRTNDMLTDFFNFIHKEGYSLSEFDRNTFIEYLETLRKSVANNDKPEEQFNRSIAVVRKFLEDIQTLEWDDIPTKDIQHIIYNTDKMKAKRKSKSDVKYIPNYVLDQLISHLDELPKMNQMIVSIMIHSGLRVSDVLRLTHDCLLKINGKYWIETDIEKTGVENHKVPIDDEVASALAVMIKQSKEKSTSENNPKNYIFCNFEGNRKGMPYTQRSISDQLNYLAQEKKITDEMGQTWKFKNHSFRHTYAVKLINNGVSLTVVQDLLAHASPEMTLTYARLVDDTKRKEWEKAYDKGAFRFDDKGKSVDVNLEEMASEEGLQWEWIRHNLDAVKVSHGFCFISAKQGCKYQVNPCLNANGGKPCKHLAVTPDFAPMYEFDIEMKKKVIAEGKQRGDEYKHWIEKNEKELNRIQEIYDIIKNGETYFQKKDTICGKGDETCPLTTKNNNN